jgi:hypothetical protein
MSSTGYLKKSLTLALLGLTLSACAMTKENTGIFRQTADDEARVVVEAAAYRNGAQQRVTYNDPRIMEEYVLYRSDQGQAEILFTQTLPMHKRNTALDFDKLISTSARMWRFNQGQTLTFDESFSVDNRITSFWVQTYRQVEAGRQCAGFSSRWDFRQDDPFYRPSKIMFGYHCAPKGTAFSSADAVAFVKSLDIRGISVPLPINTAYDLQKSPPAPPAHSEQVANMVLVQDGGGGGGIAGLPEFPLLISRTYQTGDKPCTNC